MTDSSTHWAAVRALWFSVQDAAPDRRQALLHGSAVDTDVRHEVLGLLDAADTVGERFERPALAILAGDGALAGGVLAGGVLADGAAPSLVGRRVGAYDIVRRVGQGGMGAVYEARRADAAYTQRVAIKTLWRGTDSAVLLHRFRSERQILASLQHPHIAQLLDGGSTAEGMPWLAMEYVEGVPIDLYCDTRRLPLTARLDLFRQVCAAVAFAHRNLVVHRDLKPSNVLVTTDGTVKLLDFGVAKLLDDPRGEGTLTGAGLSPFTAAYAAPEQLLGGAISTATDIYALGVLLTVLLTGLTPVDVHGLSTAALVERLRDSAPQAPSALARLQTSDAAPDADQRAVDRGFDRTSTRVGATANTRLARALTGELDAITLMALRREPERRYASVDALAADVHRYLRREQVLARPDTVAYRVRSFARRRRALVIATATVLASVLVGSAFALQQARATRREAARSERAAAFLAGVVAGPDATGSESLIRLGPRATVSQLLDSALRRVPYDFADDARIRARLYTAIGSHYLAQGRLREAVRVLDSARALARATYGATSNAFAAANLELSMAAYNHRGPADAERHARAALAALGDRTAREPALHARVLTALAQARMGAGAMREADTLARAAVALEQRRGARSLSRARAEATLAATSAWLRRDPREFVRRCRAVSALTDSLGAELSAERIYAVGCEVQGLLTLGRPEAADALLRANLPRFEAGYGDSSLAVAQLHAVLAIVLQARGDTAAQRRVVQDAWRLATRNGDVSAEAVLNLGMRAAENAWARGASAEALQVTERMRQITAGRGSALADVFGPLYVGLARARVQDWPGAESALRAGVAALPASRDMDSMLPRLRAPLAEVLARQGRAREADSVRALDPPRGAVPRCSPGGDWRGC